MKLERLNWHLNYISELKKLTEAILSVYTFDENKVFQVVASPSCFNNRVLRVQTSEVVQIDYRYSVLDICILKMTIT